jgi:predicted AlkP superfamily phosphohydrolase/phosphomutase
MAKVVIIGIDGLDPFLIEKWSDYLPNFQSLVKYNPNTDIKLESTTPPDSICAWTSIYTGENPAEHGLIESIDYLSSKKDEESIDRAAHFRGRTFWDMASKMGKRVCIINPFIAYPAWEVNGIMVSGPVFEGGDTSTYPENLIDNYNIPPLGGIVDFPDEKELGEFLVKTTVLTQQLSDVSLQIYKDQKPDLFFLTFLTMDRVQHFLWRFTDEEDIYYPGDNPLKDSIKKFYQVFDEIIGNFKNSLLKDTVLIVMSDHGHGRRCTKSLNLNEFLRKKGYLKTSDRGTKALLKKTIEKTKVFTLSTMSRYGLQDWIYKVARFIPNRKALKKSTYLINKEGSAVTLANLCGANPFGGIDVNVESKEEYERLREEIINELMGINTMLGEEIVKWAAKREQIYEGNNKDNLPDVLFELNEDYGVGMDLYTPYVTQNYTHKKVSGGHRKEGVLLVFSDNDRVKDIPRPLTVMEVKKYILDILDV